MKKEYKKEAGVVDVEKILARLSAMLRKDAEIRRKCERERQKGGMDE